jgi:5,10-methenyltetrahydromethanopterin hydrogenase
MAAKNFGLGSREPSKAGKFSLIDKNLSFSSTATITHRWNKFIPFMEEKGIRDMQETRRVRIVVVQVDSMSLGRWAEVRAVWRVIR